MTPDDPRRVPGPSQLAIIYDPGDQLAIVYNPGDSTDVKGEKMSRKLKESTVIDSHKTST